MKIKPLKTFALINCWVAYISCTHSSQNIIHLQFLDHVGSIPIKDSTNKPLIEKDLWFLINKNSDAIDFGQVNKFLQNDSVVLSNTKANYSRLDITFLKKSECTDRLLELKSSKQLTLCNDDIVVEYIRSRNRTDIFYYKNGKIIGSEEIKIETLNK